MSDKEEYIIDEEIDEEDVVSGTFEGRDIPEKLHPVCEKCIKDCREKYKDFVSADGTLYKDGFAIKCSYIPEDEIFLNKKLKAHFQEEEFNEMNSFRSALLWAKANLVNPDTGEPWQPRSYQIPPTLCTAPRVVMRFGRRCLPAGVKILMADGSEKNIESVRAGDEIKSMSMGADLFEEDVVVRRIIDFWENGVREVFRITLANGMFIDCTANHPLLAFSFYDLEEKWLSVDTGLLPGMFVAHYDETNDGIGFSKVEAIEFLNEQETFDIEVEDTHNMISNGIVSHNTGKSVTLAVLMAWYLFTGGGMRDVDTGKLLKKITILVIAPQKSQVDELLNRLRSFIYAVPKLSACIDSDTRGSPQKLSVKGEDGGPGNIIKGYASGDASGSKGVGIRGNDADVIVVDESAYVSQGVMKEVITPILMTKPTTRMFHCSTPSGIAGDLFEKNCLAMPEYKEFYASSTEMPNFNLIKASMVQEYGDDLDKWEREVEAKFPEAGAGVYKKALVRNAREEYRYEDMTPTPGMVYTIGVDWNKEKGTEIVVIGTQKAHPFPSWVVLSEKIAKKDFVTPMGIGRLVELNRIWKPAWIYVDEGGDGSTCAQMLQFVGKESAGKNILDARLMHNVKAYDFGSKIEFRDYRGKKIKRQAKPFMVENSVRKFELGEIKFSIHDQTMMKQLDNYIVTRRNTITGTPVYGVESKKIGDHRLDALNLALVAVRLELPSLNSREVVQFDSSVRHVQNSLNKPAALVNDNLPPGVNPRGLHHGVERKNEEPAPFVRVDTVTSPAIGGKRKRRLKYRGGRTWR